MITTNGEETRDFTDIRGGGSYAEESSNPLNMVAAYKKSFVGAFSHSMRKYFSKPTVVILPCREVLFEIKNFSGTDSQNNVTHSHKRIICR